MSKFTLGQRQFPTLGLRSQQPKNYVGPTLSCYLRRDNSFILLYKDLKGKATISTDDLIPKIRRCRNQHSMAFQIPSASKDAYTNSFFPPPPNYQGLE